MTLAQAHADLARLVPSMPDRFPIPTGFTRAMYEAFGLTPDVHPLHEDLVGAVSGTLWVVFGAVVLLVLVGCANVATLFLVRGDAQRQDVAVQLALGAGMRRLAGQRFGEALVVALAGAALGLTLADWGLGILRQLDVAALPRLREVRVDAAIAAVVVGLAAAAALGFALLSLVRQGRQDSSSPCGGAVVAPATGASACGCATRWSACNSRWHWSCSSARGCCYGR